MVVKRFIEVELEFEDDATDEQIREAVKEIVTAVNYMVRTAGWDPLEVDDVEVDDVE